MIKNNKSCNKCFQVLKLNEFHNNKNAKDGLFNSCKECINSKGRQWKKDNKEKHYNYNKQWAIDNRDSRNKTAREWHNRNKEKSNAASRNWKKENPELNKYEEYEI